MSEVDLPERLGATAATRKFVALRCVPEDGLGPQYAVVPAGGQSQGTRYAWWRKQGLGDKCLGKWMRLIRTCCAMWSVRRLCITWNHGRLAAGLTEAAERQSMTEFFAMYPHR